ncbi:hypothetical protein [Skermania piniformis]|uniref:Uncharacterized protein n=1 Tax=Skermania pinensis TaxID=39122 RepID=A0ABX8SCL5_9ACTN|nr:hypothetical protein [Skermania piniformis]QXQ15161.1 hypothetical protein KV203_07410 [Skermania piniformis]
MTVTTLDDLSEMSFDELGKLYAAGSVPPDLSVLDNKPKGRMLAVRGVDNTPLASVLRAAAKLPVFPWDGKSMTATDAHSGDGINRIKLGITTDWFAFKTRVEPSVVDGADTIVLDYEQPGNPWFIRQIHDELREVAPGLFVGPAMWKRSEADPVNVLWFALDARG